MKGGQNLPPPLSGFGITDINIANKHQKVWRFRHICVAFAEYMNFTKAININKVLIRGSMKGEKILQSIEQYSTVLFP